LSHWSRSVAAARFGPDAPEEHVEPVVDRERERAGRRIVQREVHVMPDRTA
jgi:hypothetical protein